MEKAKHIFNLVKEALNQAPQAPQAPQQQERKSETNVQFDSQTEAPYLVTFSERGFSIDGIRLSFETIEDAISKQYSITLQNGEGRLLDAVLMQKILKYKTLY
jgi:hypothetical protein